MARKRNCAPVLLPERRTLPFDVLHVLLAFLSQSDLRAAAGVSRTFRAAAKQAGLYIHRQIQWFRPSGVKKDIDVFQEVLDYAKREGCRLSLDMGCAGPFPVSAARMEAVFPKFRDLVKLLATCVAKALPFLVFLRVSVPGYFRPELDAALCLPAPHLHTFEIDAHGAGAKPRWPRHAHLPAALFAGAAPKLRRVSVGNIPLGSLPLPTFARVHRVLLRYNDAFPAMNIAYHFPALTNLTVDYVQEHGNDPVPSGNFSGLSLTSLSVESNEDQLRSRVSQELDLAVLPSFTFHRDAYIDGCKWDWTMRAEECAELTATITGDSNTANSDPEDVTIAISSQHRPGWHRAFCLLSWDLDQPHPFLRQGTGLVALAIENKFLTGLLESGVSFPVLREFRVNLRARGRYATMIWPVAWGIKLDEDHGGAARTGYSVPCPSLETMTIAAAAAGAHTQVKLSEVAQLAQALGQRKREDGKRARLVLRGVSLQVPTLDQLFSSVQEVAPQTA